MNFFYSYSVETPIYLFIGILFLLGIIFYFFYNKPRENFVDMQLIEEVYKTQSFWYRAYIIILFIITLGVFVLLSGLYSLEGKQTVKKNGIDIEIVFDVSHSMMAEDIKPNRLEAAKKVFGDFIGSFSSDRVGLILFAGKPFQSIPLSYDYMFLKDFISDIHINTIYQGEKILEGTAIGDGLILAADILLKGELEREKIIILITDGESTKGVSSELALKFLKNHRIKTYTIGIGKEEASEATIVGDNGFSISKTVGAIDEETLIKIADETGGKYFKADSGESFKEILDTIGKLEKKELELEVYQYHEDKSYIIIFLLMLLYIPLMLIVFLKKIHI